MDKDNVSELSLRLIRVMRELGISQAQMARACGLSPSYISNILNSGSKPSIETVMGIATHWPSINLRWLLTGEGAMQAEEATQASEAEKLPEVQKRVEPRELSSPKPRAEDYQSALEQELLKLWGVGEVALVARNGGHIHTSNLLRYLVSRYPQAVSLEHLLTLDLDGANNMDVVAAVTVLVRRGLVKKEDDGYMVISPNVEIRSDGMPELHQQALEAVREILTTILPITDHHRDRGRLVLTDAYVEDGKEFARHVIDSVRQMIYAANTNPGPERVSFVLGLAIDTPLNRNNS